MHVLRGVLVLFVLLVPARAQAELFVCGTATTLRAFFFADPTSAAAQAPDCHRIDPENGALMTSQQALLQAVPVKHLKVEGGLAVEFTAQEKADLAAADAAAAAARKLFLDEVEAVGVCKFDTLAQLEATLQTRKANRLDQLNTAETQMKADIATLTFTNIATAVTNIRAKMDAIATRQFIVERALLDELYLGVMNIARCDFARAKVGGR